jgi:hypothetical protein
VCQVTAREVRLSGEFLALRPDAEYNPTLYLFWDEMMRTTADTLFERPDYDKPRTRRMADWQVFVDHARYAKK